MQERYLNFRQRLLKENLHNTIKKEGNTSFLNDNVVFW